MESMVDLSSSLKCFFFFLKGTIFRFKREERLGIKGSEEQHSVLLYPEQEKLSDAYRGFQSTENQGFFLS